MCAPSLLRYDKPAALICKDEKQYRSSVPAVQAGPLPTAPIAQQARGAARATPAASRQQPCSHSACKSRPARRSQQTPTPMQGEKNTVAVCRPHRRRPCRLLHMCSRQGMQGMHLQPAQCDCPFCHPCKVCRGFFSYRFQRLCQLRGNIAALSQLHQRRPCRLPASCSRQRSHRRQRHRAAMTLAGSPNMPGCPKRATINVPTQPFPASSCCTGLASLRCSTVAHPQAGTQRGRAD